MATLLLGHVTGGRGLIQRVLTLTPFHINNLKVVFFKKIDFLIFVLTVRFLVLSS